MIEKILKKIMRVLSSLTLTLRITGLMNSKDQPNITSTDKKCLTSSTSMIYSGLICFNQLIMEMHAIVYNLYLKICKKYSWKTQGNSKGDSMVALLASKTNSNIIL